MNWAIFPLLFGQNYGKIWSRMKSNTLCRGRAESSDKLMLAITYRVVNRINEEDRVHFVQRTVLPLFHNFRFKG